MKKIITCLLAISISLIFSLSGNSALAGPNDIAKSNANCSAVITDACQNLVVDISEISADAADIPSIPLPPSLFLFATAMASFAIVALRRKKFRDT